jgi:hypothetical protein
MVVVVGGVGQDAVERGCTVHDDREPTAAATPHTLMMRPSLVMTSTTPD